MRLEEIIILDEAKLLESIKCHQISNRFTMTPSIEKIKEMLATNGLYPKPGKSDEEIIEAAKKIIEWTLGMQEMQNKRELNEIKRNSGLTK